MFGNFFKGRYGVDTLAYVLLFVGIIMLRFPYVSYLGIGLFVFMVFRIFSRDKNKRYQEQQKLNQMLSKLTKSFTRQGSSAPNGYNPFNRKSSTYNSPDRKLYVILSCPKCSNNLRLPRKKGKLQVTCPVCKTEFIKKT